MVSAQQQVQPLPDDRFAPYRKGVLHDHYTRLATATKRTVPANLRHTDRALTRRLLQ